MSKKKLWIVFVLLVIFLGYLIFFFGTDRSDFLSLLSSKLRVFTDENFATVLIFSSLVSVIAFNIPIPFAAVFKISSGMLFGTIGGSVFNIITTICGACIGFAFYRCLLSGRLRKWLEKKHKKLISQINEEIKDNGLLWFFIARLIMIFPYYLLHLAAGLSKIKFRPYFVSTVIGVLPSSYIYAQIGADFDGIATGQPDVVTFVVLIIFVLFIMIGIYKHPS